MPGVERAEGSLGRGCSGQGKNLDWCVKILVGPPDWCTPFQKLPSFYQRVPGGKYQAVETEQEDEETVHWRTHPLRRLHLVRLETELWKRRRRLHLCLHVGLVTPAVASGSEEPARTGFHRVPRSGKTSGGF